jgi:hypothetical protein
MQTFLPYPDFDASARCLDQKRLGKQRVETLQIVNAHLNTLSGWRNHPACQMWIGHTFQLIRYGVSVCTEWRSRGHDDTVLDKLLEIQVGFSDVLTRQDMPWWMGDAPFHASHRSNLLRKDPHWYGQFGWYEPTTLSYLWPGRERGTFARSKG